MDVDERNEIVSLMQREANVISSRAGIMAILSRQQAILKQVDAEMQRLEAGKRERIQAQRATKRAEAEEAAEWQWKTIELVDANGRAENKDRIVIANLQTKLLQNMIRRRLARRKSKPFGSRD
jgi:hypothetical protein